MLDDFIEEQKIATKILKNAVKKNKVSHAYLLETNGYEKKEQFLLSFVKYLLCPNQYSNSTNCKNCYQCQNIEKNNFSEVKHIYPEGLWIKKEQLLDLQKEFSEKSIHSDKRIYIIHEAEKMNSSASNSILKFLEEPEDNIIAILVTDNVHQLLDTILSRCQIISLRKNNIYIKENLIERLKQEIEWTDELNQLEDEIILDKITKTIEFIDYFEKNHLDVILYTQSKFHEFFQDKNEIILFFNLASLFYLEILKYKTKQQITLFLDYNTIISSISNINTIEKLTNKIEIIINAKNHVKYNINSNLLIDKLIIDMNGGV